MSERRSVLPAPPAPPKPKRESIDVEFDDVVPDAPSAEALDADTTGPFAAQSAPANTAPPAAPSSSLMLSEDDLEEDALGDDDLVEVHDVETGELTSGSQPEGTDARDGSEQETDESRTATFGRTPGMSPSGPPPRLPPPARPGATPNTKSVAPGRASIPPAALPSIFPGPVDVGPGEREPWDGFRAASLREAGAWTELLNMYLTHIGDFDEGAPRAEAYVTAARIAENELEALDRAFGLYFLAVECAPTMDEAQVCLEQVARKLGNAALPRWAQAIQRMQKLVERTQDISLRAAYLSLLARWHVFELKRRDVATEFFTKLAKVDPTHPVLLERRANEARADGDLEGQRHHLLEALERATRTDDRARIFLALGELHEGPLADPLTARGYYETVLSETEPSDLTGEALKALERLARATGDASLAKGLLERQLALPQGDKQRFELRLRLAEEHEKLGESDEAETIASELAQADGTSVKALQLLERLQTKRGAYAEAADTMALRAQFAPHLKAKCDILFTAAETLEQKAGDLPAAYEMLSRIVFEDEKNKRAHRDLQRIATARNMPREAFIHGTAVANLTGDRKESAGLHADLGFFALDVLADAASARGSFERALEIDKRSDRALQGIERLARDKGDRGAVLQALEQRAQAGEDKRTRAERFAVLAEERLAAEDRDGAIQAYEIAYASAKDLRDESPSKEAPAMTPDMDAMGGALLELYVERGRFEQAQPLCEELIMTAQKTGNRALHVRRLRMQIRIAAGLNQEELAVDSAVAALQIAPENPNARADLLDVVSRVSPEWIGKARAELVRLGSHARDLSFADQLRLATAQVAAGDITAALRTLEHAAAANPDDPTPLSMMEPHLEERARNEPEQVGPRYQAAYTRLAEVKYALGRLLTDPERSFEKLTQAGDVYARHLNDVRQAVPIFEEAARKKPNDPWLRETLAWAYEQIGDWARFANSLVDAAKAETDPNKRADTQVELAIVLAKRLADAAGAIETLGRVLDANPKRLDAFEHQVRILTETRNWVGLEAAYQAMIGRVRGSGDVVEAALSKQLGVLYRDRLQDAPRAMEAMREASRLDPKDIEVRNMLIELVMLDQDWPTAVRTLRGIVATHPLEPRTYEHLFEAFYNLGDFDRAWCALDVLAQLVPLEGDKLKYYHDYPPIELAQFPGTLTEDAWRTHLLHPELDPSLTALLSWLAPPVVRAANRPPQEGPLSPHHGPNAAAVIDIFANAGEILNLAPPQLLATQMPEAFAHRPGVPEALAVNPQRIPTDAGERLFQSVARFAELRPELYAIGHFAGKDAIGQLIGRAVQNDPATLGALSGEERGAVAQILDRAKLEGSKFDTKRWTILAQNSIDRVATLLTGSANPAALHYSRMHDDPYATEKLGLLYSFLVSDEYGDLRTALGIAIGSS